ncbi:rolling circle replication-associated protein [Microterricola viridarii]|uniref:rolling circle replication-associated protein n=1 Tax=Microterricola viridarii TaxID=412690 RepID=UPI001E63EB69|nr:hypothetical protein [Microterricola viridarii]
MQSLVRPDAGWQFSLYPDAGEGGGSFQYSVRRVPEYVASGSAADPERAAAEAGRRARAKLRRYCAANRLNRLGTLTYAGAGNHDPAALREHLAGFFRALRESLGGAALPYVWVPEWHKSGHGLHAHFAVGRYIKRSLILDAWPHGFVHIKLLGDLPVGSGDLSQARRAAGYLSKYVAKTFADPTVRDLGLHRYDVAQGFQPAVLRLSASSSDAVIGAASELMSGAPVTRWSSAENADWQGAPAIWAQWGR